MSIIKKILFLSLIIFDNIFYQKHFAEDLKKLENLKIGK